MIYRYDPRDLKPNEEIYGFRTQNSEYYSKDLDELRKVHKSNKSKTKSKIALYVNTWSEQYKVWYMALKRKVE